MADRLIIHYDGTRAAWLDAQATLVEGDLAQAVTALGDRQAVVLLPSEDILLTRVRLPPIRQTNRRLQAARYALEDQVVARVDSLHFALAARADSDNETAVAVIDAQRLRSTLNALGQAHIDVFQILPDVLALPRPTARGWQAALINDRILVRTRIDHGFASERALWPALAAGCAPPEKIRLWVDDAAQADALPQLAFEDAPPVEPEPDKDGIAPLARLLQHADTSGAINLRQGDFARASAMQTWWQPFKITAGLAAAWLIVAVTARAVESWQLSQRIDALRATSEAAFRDAFPRVRTINDLQVQAEEKIRALRGTGASSGIFPLLQATAEVTGEVGDLRIQSLQYRDGTLYLSLRGENVQALESLRAGFARQVTAALTVESADAAADGVQIRASVSGADA